MRPPSFWMFLTTSHKEKKSNIFETPFKKYIGPDISTLNQSIKKRRMLVNHRLIDLAAVKAGFFIIERKNVVVIYAHPPTLGTVHYNNI